MVAIYHFFLPAGDMFDWQRSLGCYLWYRCGKPDQRQLWPSELNGTYPNVGVLDVMAGAMALHYTAQPRGCHGQPGGVRAGVPGAQCQQATPAVAHVPPLHPGVDSIPHTGRQKYWIWNPFGAQNIATRLCTDYNYSVDCSVIQGFFAQILFPYKAAEPHAESINSCGFWEKL